MDQYLGQLMLFAGTFAPKGWALCNGQLLSVQQNQALFSILGVTYGGDGRTTFGLPDLRGRAASHSGLGPNLKDNVVLGQKYGTETNVLTVDQMPAHTHAISGTFKMAASSTNDEDSETPEGSYLRATTGVSSYASSTDGFMGSSPLTTVNITIGTAGLGAPVNNIQPSLGLIYCIALTGIFPSRS